VCFDSSVRLVKLLACTYQTFPSVRLFFLMVALVVGHDDVVVAGDVSSSLKRVSFFSEKNVAARTAASSFAQMGGALFLVAKLLFAIDGKRSTTNQLKFFLTFIIATTLFVSFVREQILCCFSLSEKSSLAIGDPRVCSQFIDCLGRKQARAGAAQAGSFLKM